MVGYVHTTLATPLLARSAQLGNVGPSQVPEWETIRKTQGERRVTYFLLFFKFFFEGQSLRPLWSAVAAIGRNSHRGRRVDMSGGQTYTFKPAEPERQAPKCLPHPEKSGCCPLITGFGCSNPSVLLVVSRQPNFLFRKAPFHPPKP